MKIIYIISVLTLSLVGTLSIDRKQLAIPYYCALVFLPSDLSFTLGTVNIWGTDLLSVLTLLVIILRGGLAPPFKVSFIDILLPLMCCWRAICLIVAREDASTLVQDFFRWFLPYFFPYAIGRIGCRSWTGMKNLIRVMLSVALILCAFTAIEAFTGHNVLNQIGLGLPPRDIKWGLWRSHATLSSLHILGMYFGFLSIVSLSSFIADPKDDKRSLVTFFILSIGTVMSTSATGITLAAIGLGFMFLYPLRNYYKIWGMSLLALNVLVHFASTNGIHHVYANRLSFLGESYYRALLIDEVLARMANHWLFGLGNEKVTVWFVSYEDICSMWLWFLARAALPGFLCWSLFYLFLFGKLRICYRLIIDHEGERLFVWGMVSAIFALGCALHYIAFVGSDVALFTLFFGLIASFPDLAAYSLQKQSVPSPDNRIVLSKTTESSIGIIES